MAVLTRLDLFMVSQSTIMSCSLVLSLSLTFYWVIQFHYFVFSHDILFSIWPILLVRLSNEVLNLDFFHFEFIALFKFGLSSAILFTEFIFISRVYSLISFGCFCFLSVYSYLPVVWRLYYKLSLSYTNVYKHNWFLKYKYLCMFIYIHI